MGLLGLYSSYGASPISDPSTPSTPSASYSDTSEQDASILQGIGLTIYNNDFALVKDFVKLDLKDGFNKASYEGATMSVEPASVVLQPIFGDENDDYRHEVDDYKPRILITEQSYRNDVLSPAYMLSLFEGKTIDFLIQTEEGEREVVSGKVIRSGYEVGGASQDPIIEVEGKLRFGVPGVPLFPSLGDDTLLKPRLEWQVFSSQPFQGHARLSYLTRGLSWLASYNLVLPEKGDLANITGFVTISNNSGRDFQDASLDLMAGDVNRVSSPMYAKGGGNSRSPMMAEAMDFQGVTQKSFDEYHLYTLPTAVTLRDKEVKQVEFVSAQNVMVKTIYRVVGQELYSGAFYEAPDVTLTSPTHVSVVRRIENCDSNLLGIPLPAGVLRLYRKDGDTIQFVGENSINHTPKNERIEVVTGSAFDVMAKRVRTHFEVSNVQYLGNRNMTETFEYTLKNRKQERVTVNIVDYLRGPNWTITAESHPHKKTSATEVQWDVQVEADSEVKVTYTVEYKW